MDLAFFLTGTGLIALAFLIAGLALVIFEMYNPGFGAPGILGMVFLAVGIIISSKSIFQAFVLIIIILAILGVALALVFRSASKGHLSKRLVLNDALEEDSNSDSDDTARYMGREGIALTVLRPAGAVDFEGVKMDVVSDGEFIPKGTAVKIVNVEGNKIVVQRK